MDKYFGEWYATVAVEMNDDLLKKRWAGIEKACEALDLQALLNLVRISKGHTTAPPEFIDIFRDFFFKADATFRPRGNELEVRVLADSTLALALSDLDEASATKVALALVCSDCKGLGAQNAVPAVSERAQQYLIDRSKNLRASAISRTVAIGKLPTKDQLEKLVQAADVSDLAKNVRGAVEQIATAVTGVSKALASTSAAYNLLLEELDILWWLFGAYSTDLGQPFGSVPPLAAPLFAAKDLSAMTNSRPGPLASPAILSRMLRNVRKLPSTISLTDALSGVSDEVRDRWTRELAKNPNELDFCPVALALAESVQLHDVSAGVSAAGARLDFNKEGRLSPADLSVQFYQEQLFLK